MAGLPFVTARGSADQCTKYGIDPPPGTAFQIFRTIQKMLPEPIYDLGGSIDSLKEHLLKTPGGDLPHLSELRKNWYFVESAIRSAARDARAPFGSFAFRVFAEYSRTSKSHALAEAVLAEAQRLVLGGEEGASQADPQWSKPAKHGETDY